MLPIRCDTTPWTQRMWRASPRTNFVVRPGMLWKSKWLLLGFSWASWLVKTQKSCVSTSMFLTHLEGLSGLLLQSHSKQGLLEAQRAKCKEFAKKFRIAHHAPKNSFKAICQWFAFLLIPTVTFFSKVCCWSCGSATCPSRGQQSSSTLLA